MLYEVITLASFRDYHCVELEMHGKDARKMEAIWVV